MSKYGKEFDARFWSNVNVLDKESCWDWLLSVCGSGYGQVRISIPTRSKINTHRIAYELFYGPIPKGTSVLHSCNNKRCCNPNHLRLGNQSMNLADSINYYKGHFNQHNKRFDNNDRIIMCTLRSSGITYNVIGEIFNCTGNIASRIINKGA
jgi:hypothetical protein